MIYPKNFEQKISFDKIRSLLKEKCISILGKEKVDEMAFSADYETVCRTLAETDEMRTFITDENTEFPLTTFFDLREGLARIRVEGLYLDAGELFDLRRSLEVINSVVRFITDKPDSEIPQLKRLTEGITVFPAIVQKIDFIVNKFGNIKDNASTELSRIRKEMFTVQGGVSKTLQSILRKAQADGLVEKGAQPTMREGRLVIPIPPAYKRRLQGIVHDESATGKTVFVEPAEVVEQNNRLRELEAEERREIIRILVEFSNFLRPSLEDILQSYQFLATVDFVRAKALFSLTINAIKPAVSTDCLLDWHKAIHPILFLSLQKQGKEIVPLDITLNERQRILLISGPNAGGKSVCLKTVGLLQYMLQCGLLVSLHESSRMGIFERLFIDIGDEQSIENDLSTYSSHLTNMKFFVRNTNHRTLLLIDEFGGGTEPMIGGAIAESLLEKYNENRTFGVITTHYTNLKHFAQAAEGIVNGAMLYDRHQMQPLFRLEVGNAGSSFAIEIARKIGLPETVIQAATEKVGAEHIDYDKHLQDIARDKRYWENKRQQIRQREKQLDELVEKYQSELQKTDKQRKEIVRQAKTEASALLQEVNAKIENTIREIKTAQAEKERTRTVRKELEEFKTELLNANDTNDANSRKLNIEYKHKKNGVNLRNSLDLRSETPTQTPIVVGDNVRLKGQSVIGQIIEIQGKTATVSFGQLKSTVKLDKLERLSNTQVKKEQRQTAILGSTSSEEIRQRKLAFKSEIDVRGMRADEALQAVTYFIDDALMVGVASVRILHGTGTGALRQVIRQYLATIGSVSKFHDEHVQFGGAGITVVEF